jgi:hypothetical protein
VLAGAQFFSVELCAQARDARLTVIGAKTRVEIFRIVRGMT